MSTVSVYDFTLEVDAPVTCAVCRHDIEHGWFGLARGSHCRGCHRTHTAGCHCYAEGCHRHFSSGSGFDLHQRDGQCRDISALTYTCGAPKFAVLGSPGAETITGTRHETVCKDWTVCGFRQAP